ncbi:MAG: hypothetical protein KF697_01900 [Pseudolabrys sp.]|nr:hypothetical protein [Pseudolabrys sp.]
MTDARPSRTAATLIAEALVSNGVERVFCVPGESYLALLDALYDTDIEVTVFRHEGAAAFAAEAWGKLTGRPGILMVTRGPGMTNASAGLHVARQDSTPVIAFVGQVARSVRGREAFQEVDTGAMLGEVAKLVETIDDAARAPEIVSRAYYVATSGRPGPVVLALPEDMLSARADTPDIPPPALVPATASPEQAAAVAAALAGASRPLVVAGGPHWSAQAAADLARFAEAWDLPVAVTFRRQDRLSNDHPCYAGDLGVGMNPALAARLAAALATQTFRPYASGDPTGVAIGGAVKNVLAIACGIAEGKVFGASARPGV